nr:hypothetical protein [Tanacetum cinerariifolium]
MHLYKFSLNETHAKWLVKCYKILEELHPRVVPEGMTMDELDNCVIGLYVHHFQQGELRVPFSTSRVGKDCKLCFKYAPTSLKKWKDNFFLVDRRAVPIAMAWKHHDSSVADPHPKSKEFIESDAERLCEVVITLHKPSPSLLYADGLSHSWKHVKHVSILKDPKGK